MDTKHTRGPWRLEGDYIVPDDAHSLLPVARLCRAEGHEAEDDANGGLIAAAPELLNELLRAEVVIQTMLGLMTTEQKLRMAKLMEASLIAGGDATRHYKRRAVIRQAAAALKAHGTR